MDMEATAATLIVSSATRVIRSAFLHGFGFLAFRQFKTPKVLISRHERNYWASSIISTIHAIAMCFGACRIIASGDVDFWGGGYAVRSSEWERFIELSTGYFLYDFLFMVFPNTACEPVPSKEMIFHHIVSVVTHYYPVCVCHYGVAISVVGYLAEFSTPFTNARWMLKEAGGGTGTKIYLLNGLLLAVSFFLCRTCNLAFLLYMIFVAHPRFTDGLSLGEAMGGGLGHAIAPLTVVFYFLNAFWMWKIANGLVKAVQKLGKKEE